MSEFNRSQLAGVASGEGHLTLCHKSGIPCETSFLRPLFSVYALGSSSHKVIKFHDAFTDMAHRSLPKLDPVPRAVEGRYREHIVRAKSTITELILCNEWDYFFTGTLDPNKFDRYSLARFKSALSQFIRDQRKKYGRGEGKTFRYVLVPERHADGAWHIHGVIGGIPVAALSAFSDGVPRHLIEGGYLNWPDYQSKFGFCSLGKVRSSFACAFYIRKYISKGFADAEFERNEHMYFASLGLNRRVKVSDYYTGDSELDACLTNFSPFCDTGIVQGKPWYFGLDGEVIFDSMLPVFVPVPDQEDVSCPEWEDMQLSIDSLVGGMV